MSSLGPISIVQSADLVVACRIAMRISASDPGSRRLGRLRLRRLHSDQAHHSTILMLQEMAMINERPHGIRIAKIHPQSNTGIFKRFAGIVGNVDGIAKKRLIHGSSKKVEQ